MYELRLLVTQNEADIICDALEQLDAVSVSLEDADAHTEAEQALFGEPNAAAEPATWWQRSIVVALFHSQTAAQHAAAVIQAQDFFQQSQILSTQAVPEQDWVRITQAQFEPVAITPEFWIVPSWHDVPHTAQHHIRLDPGLAFGTGTHPTTSMCLRWLIHNQHILPSAPVLDYGCGSGILAIAAAKLGAQTVDAVDIDPDAVAATQHNAQRNHSTLRCGLPDMVNPAQAQYTIVLANILAMPLQVLAPLLCAHIAQNGHILLAGILQRQAQALQAAYAPYIALDVIDTKDDWILMHGQAPHITASTPD